LLLILDQCNLSLAAEPSGGVTLRVTEIEGLPNTTLLIPVVRDSATQLYDGMGSFLEKTKVYGLDDMRREAHAGPSKPATGTT
jgi:hypothetical protein